MTNRLPIKTKLKKIKDTIPKAKKQKPLIKSKEKELTTPQGLSIQSGPLTQMYAQRLDEIDKKLKLSSNTSHPWSRMSTGCLVADYIMGGGIVPGMYQIAGPEQSAKTTLCHHTFGQSLLLPLSLREFWDAENAVDATYSGNIWQFPMSSIFPKHARYYDENVLEDFFDHFASALRSIPNKRWSEEAQCFTYQIPKGKEGSAQSKALRDIGLKADSSLADDSFIYFPTENSYPEGIVFVDSWVSLILEEVDDQLEGSKKGKAMAVVARKFAEQLPRVVGKLRRKAIILFGVNQIREKPGVLYGSPEYEPGGSALKFYSMVRNQVRARASHDNTSWKKDKDNTAVYVEDSPLGGKDYYQFKKMKNTKNKFSTPFLEGWIRIWTKDNTGQGRGIDPVFDTAEFLRLTGYWLDSKRKPIKSVSGSSTAKIIVDVPPINEKILSWEEFKMLIIAEITHDKELTEKVMKLLKLSKPFGLRKWCRDQLMENPSSLIERGNSIASQFTSQSDSENDDDDDDENFYEED